MMIKEYSRVRLKDGREGTVVDVLGGGKSYCVDFRLPGGGWDFDLFLPEEIECVISEPK